MHIWHLVYSTCAQIYKIITLINTTIISTQLYTLHYFIQNVFWLQTDNLELIFFGFILNLNVFVYKNAGKGQWRNEIKIYKL